MIMNKLPYDVSRCSSVTTQGTCPIRDECLRFVDKAEDGQMIPYMTNVELNEDGSCPRQVPLQEK